MISDFQNKKIDFLNKKIDFLTKKIDLQNKKLETPIGVSCRICPRVDCQQRAFPPIDKDLKLA